MIKTFCLRIPGRIYLDTKGIAEANYTTVNGIIVRALVEYAANHNERNWNFLRDPRNTDSIYTLDLPDETQLS